MLQCLICPITGWSDRDTAAGEMPFWETIIRSLYINSWRFSLEFCLISFFLLLFLKNLVTPAPVIWPTPRVRGWETPNKSDMRANWKGVFLAGLLQNTETDVKRHRGAAMPHCCLQSPAGSWLIPHWGFQAPAWLDWNPERQHPHMRELTGSVLSTWLPLSHMTWNSGYIKDSVTAIFQ